MLYPDDRGEFDFSLKSQILNFKLGCYPMVENFLRYSRRAQLPAVRQNCKNTSGVSQE